MKINLNLEVSRTELTKIRETIEKHNYLAKLGAELRGEYTVDYSIKNSLVNVLYFLGVRDNIQLILQLEFEGTTFDSATDLADNLLTDLGLFLPIFQRTQTNYSGLVELFKTSMRSGKHSSNRQDVTPEPVALLTPKPRVISAVKTAK